MAFPSANRQPSRPRGIDSARFGGHTRGMADPAHRRKLGEGASAWNAWRGANPSIVPDLEGLFGSLGGLNLGSLAEPLDLRGARLASADLSAADLSGADLSGADLTAANLDRAILTGARMAGATIKRARLAGARGLDQAQVEGCRGDSSTRLPMGLAVPAAWPRAGLGTPAPAYPPSRQSVAAVERALPGGAEPAAERVMAEVLGTLRTSDRGEASP